MTPAAYIEMAQTEDQHWWYVARRKIICSVLESLELPSSARILEVGSGTSGNLDMLARFGRVSAVEMDDTARQISAEKT
ncbi:MAG: methyltransferase, partial [Beijerinckiaceae bacterium]|nr:methyltransferase [Beijerinckiaceae bacterium]